MPIGLPIVSRRNSRRGAFAVGDDVFFRAGQFEPHTPSGLRLLAHESAHTVQQSGTDVTTPWLPDVDGENSAFESEASRMGKAAIDASIPPLSALSHAPVAQVQRWPWSDDEEKKPEAAPSPSLWDSIKSAGSTALDYGNAAGKAVTSAESAAYNGVTGAYGSVAPDFTKGNKRSGRERRRRRGLAKKGNAKAASKADGSVLGSLEKASIWMSNTSNDATGGIVKGVGDLASVAGNAIFHPIDAAGGMLEGGLGIAEHVPLIPGLNTTVKGMHGLWDLANDKKNSEYGSSLGDLGENLLLGTHTQTDPDGPSKKSNADVDFFAGIGGGTKTWSEKPAEAATRTITNLLPMILGDELNGGKKPAAGPPVPEVAPGEMPQPGPSPNPRSPLSTTGAFQEVPGPASAAGETGSFGMKGKTLPPFDPSNAWEWGQKTFEPGQINFPNPLPDPVPPTMRGPFRADRLRAADSA